MNDRRSPERLVSAWFELEAPPGAPDALRDEIDRATSRIRPRPAWLARLKGSPMDVITGGAQRRDARLVPILLLVGLLLAIAAAVAMVGSRPPNDRLAVIPSGDASQPIATASAAGSPSIAPPPSALADASVQLPYPVLEIVPGDDALWVSVAGEDTNELARAIYRVDPTTTQATLAIDEMPAEARSHLSFVEAQGSLWIVEDEQTRMFRFDSGTGELLDTIPLGDFPIEPAVAFGAVWSQNYGDGSLTRIDPSTGDVVTTVVIPSFAGQGPRDFAVGAELLWVITPRQNVLVGIDPATNTVAREFALANELHCGVAVTTGRVWVGDCDGKRVQVVDEATGAALGTFEGFPGEGLPLHEDGGVVWVPTGDEVPPLSTKLVPLDPATLDTVERAGADLGVIAGSMTVGFDSLWYGSGTELYRLSLEALPRN